MKDRSMKLRPVSMIAIAVIAVLTILAASDSRNRLLLLRPLGSATSHDPFRVIGLSPGAARSRLEGGGLRFDHARPGGRCLYREYGVEAAVHVFADASWRRGTVCLIVRDGAVSEVVWHFDPLAP